MTVGFSGMTEYTTIWFKICNETTKKQQKKTLHRARSLKYHVTYLSMALVKNALVLSCFG